MEDKNNNLEMEDIVGNSFVRTFGSSGKCRSASGSFEYLIVLSDYEGRIYTKELGLEMYIDIIYRGISIPQSVGFKKFKENKSLYSKEDIYDLLIEKLGSLEAVYKEANKRVKTYYVGLMSFCFCTVLSNKPITLTQTGRLIVDCLKENSDRSKKVISCILTTVLCKMQQNCFNNVSPYKRKMGNKKSPFPFLLALLKEVEYIGGTDYIVLSGWHNSNVKACAGVINEIRSLGIENKSKVVPYVMDICDIKQDKVYKYSNTESDNTEDNIIKVFTDNLNNFYIETGLVKLSNDGYLYLNYNEMETIDYIIDTYLNVPSYSSYEEQVKSLLEIDKKFYIDVIEKLEILEKFKSLSEITSFDEIKEKIYSDMSCVENHKKPAYFEYNINLLLQKLCSSDTSEPHYSLSSDCEPIAFAGGNQCDFIMKNSKLDMLGEVTLLSRDKEQIERELDSITNHAIEYANNNDKDCFMLFVAPVINDKMKYLIKGFNLMPYKCKILALSLDELYEIVDKLNLENRKITIEDIYKFI